MVRPLFLAPERPADAAVADGLIARAFGPGRYPKAAERLREGLAPIAELSFLAWVDGRALGCVRLWPIAIGERPAVLLGPIAVEESERSAGVGAVLIQRACEAAQTAGWALVLLVGDEAYFGQFGFTRTDAVTMPGPVDPRRVLVRALAPGAGDGLNGAVHAAMPSAVPVLALAAE